MAAAKKGEATQTADIAVTTLSDNPNDGLTLREAIAAAADAGDERRQPGVIDVLANDGAATGSPRLVAGPGQGLALLTAGSRFIYLPDPEFTGTDRFTYAITEAGVTSEARVSVGATAWGRPAIIGSEAAEVLGGTRKGELVYGLGASDSVIGNDGDDLLSGGAGAGSLNGGEGAGLYLLNTPFGVDQLPGFTW